jgi:3-methyladenine DNA glycosylase Mpg
MRIVVMALGGCSSCMYLINGKRDVRVTTQFSCHPDPVARDLIGMDLSFDRAGGIIVETESYDADDRRSQVEC